MDQSINRGELLGHPKGLFVLFGTEMWERMSYYGMRGIFILYLTSAAAVGAFGWGNLSDAQIQSNVLGFLGTFMMGIWFFFTAMGNYLAAVAGKIVGQAGPLATFAGVAIFCIGAGIALYLLSDKIVSWMHGADRNCPESKTVQPQITPMGEAV